MKKFLFTLCAVLVGFAANAATNPHYQLAFADANGNPVTEIEVTPGQEVPIHIQLVALDQVAKGHQMEFVMYDIAGARIDNDGVVAIKGVKTTPAPNAPKKYFTAEGMALFDGNSTAEAVNGDGEINYRVLGSNSSQNMFFAPAEALAADWQMSVDDVVAFYGTTVQFGNIYSFSIITTEGWDEEYATLALNHTYTKLAVEPITEQQLDEDLTLKIKNANFTPAVELVPPTITMEQTDDLTMTVTVACETPGATLIVNGQAVEGNPYIYTVTRPDVYTAQTVTATAKSVLGEETSAEVSESKAFEPVEDLPTAAKPVITFAETKNANNEVTQVTVQIENWTSATINDVTYTNTRGDVKTFTANYVAEQPIHVEAVNAPGYPYETNTAEDDYTLNKLAQIPSEGATITTTMDDNNVYVWATGPNVVLYDAQGNAVDPQPLTLPRNDYSEENEGYTVNVSATTQQEGEPNQYAPTTVNQEITVPNKPKPVTPDPTEKTGLPVFNGYTTDGIHAYYVGISNAPGFENATIYYRVFKDGVIITATDENPEGWVTYEEILSYTVDGSYRVEAYAVADGYLPSDQIGYEFVVSPTTGMVDVLNGKTIANVRYFNMAGQEMQEANGITIVVTTYTDGTTNTVKVMK
jgi:hypothetical protein